MSIIRKRIDSLSLSTLFLIGLSIFFIRGFLVNSHRVISGCMETNMLVGDCYLATKYDYFFRQPERLDVITFNDPFSTPLYSGIYGHFYKYFVSIISTSWTKRVIGLPGDHVQGRIENGTPVIYINGNRLEEPYINRYPLVLVTNSPQEWRSYDPTLSYKDQPFYCLDTDYIRSLHASFKSSGYLYKKDPYTPLPDNKDTYDVRLRCKERDGINEYWLMGDNRLNSWDSRFFGPVREEFITGKIKFCFFSIDNTSPSIISDIISNPKRFFNRIRLKRCFKFLKSWQK